MPLDGIHDTAILAIHDVYARFAYTPQHNQWTILASFFLTRPNDRTDGEEIKIISLATGTKCLPVSRLSPRGEVVHDSHAEVLARRAALRWFLEEIRRIYSGTDADATSHHSPWLIQRPEDGKVALRTGVKLNLYVSTIPCGDASMRYLAAIQDPAIAALKDSHRLPGSISPSVPAAARGRDDYFLLGVLRTKPGRADSPPTRCMACSDKIARWAVLGVQGALGARVLAPLYISTVVVGIQEVPRGLREVVREDCERAFSGRVAGVEGLPEGYALHVPVVSFTDVPFVHARSTMNSSCNESLCWTADMDSESHPEILINGLRRGVSPKHRYREKSRPTVSRIALFTLAVQADALIHGNDIKLASESEKTFLQVKQEASTYTEAKSRLMSLGGPFSGWVKTGQEWQRFNLSGKVVENLDKEECKDLHGG